MPRTWLATGIRVALDIVAMTIIKRSCNIDKYKAERLFNGKGGHQCLEDPMVRNDRRT